MNKIRFFAALVTALLAVAGLSFAHEGESHQMKIVVGGDADTFEIGELEVGETRQLFTESGKEVVITRNESGYEVNVDGKEINIVSPGHHSTSYVQIDREGEGDGEATIDVMVKGFTGGHGEENVFIVKGDDDGGEHAYVWHGKDGEEHEIEGNVMFFGNGEGHEGQSFVFRKQSRVLDHVLESEVLDQLDEATRQQIIDVIKEAEKEGPMRRFHTGTHTIVIDSDEDGTP